MALAIGDQIRQLEKAHQIVLSDPKLYPQIVESILPIVGVAARIELRRWGAEFLAETFASPAVLSGAKESMAMLVLPTLRELLDAPGEDVSVHKALIQVAASIYGFVFKHIISNPGNVSLWNMMNAIKSNILRRFDHASTSVKICCIKFFQQVIQIQTPGPVTDPRRPERNEVSVALVPADHPLILIPRLEPEASGLLDRLLDLLNHNASDAIVICAAINCLAVLLRTRHTVGNKILSALLAFDPFKNISTEPSPITKVQAKSMERTVRAVLMNLYRRTDHASTITRIKTQLERLMQARLNVLDEGATRKRGLVVEPTDGLDPAKRRRLAAEIPIQEGKRLTPGAPHTLADVFTLSQDQSLTSFDVTQLPVHLAASIAQGLLQRIGQAELDRSTQLVRARLHALETSLPGAPEPGGLGDDDEDYEPDFEPVEDAGQVIEDGEQVENRVDVLPPEDDPGPSEEVSIGTFRLPKPPPLSLSEAVEAGKSSLTRVFNMIDAPGDIYIPKQPQLGINRTAASKYDKESWITILTRLATRAPSEDADGPEGTTMAEAIRNRLFEYVLGDFRARIHIAILWLNEEWYNDQIRQKQPGKYLEGVLRVLDGIIPYLDAKDKLLIRFLSEIPMVDAEVLQRVKRLADDPERVDLSVKTLQYLILLKPPAREIALDAVEELWRRNDDAKVVTTKLLTRWRPQILPAPEPTAEIPDTSASAPMNQDPPASPARPPSQNGVKDEAALASPPAVAVR